ncbi:MAG: sialidase family protein [Rhodocyclaceae bacterium]
MESEHPGRFEDVVASPSGAIHLAWHTGASLLVRGNGYLSSSHDGGSTWQEMKIAPDWGSFDFLSILPSGRLVAGSTMDLPQHWWFSPRLWWSDDDGTNWHYQDVQTDYDPLEENSLHVEEPKAMVEHQGKLIVWVRERTSAPPPSHGFDIRDRLYYWDQNGAALSRLPIVLPTTGPLAVQADYQFSALATGQNGYLYLAIEGEVFRTSDALSWEALPRANEGAQVMSLTVLADGTLVAGLDNQENVYFYKDGLGWRQALLPEDQENADKSLSRAYSVGHIIELQSGALLVAAEDLVYASCDVGENWEQIAALPEARTYQPNRLTQSPDGTVWGSFIALNLGSSGTSSFSGKLLKIPPPAGVAARDFIKC